MVYLACIWAFDQTARISEYTRPEQGNPDHCVRVDRLTITLDVGESVRASGLFPLLAGDTPEGAVKLEDVLECHVRVVTTNKSVMKAKLISRSSPEESGFLEDIITLIVKSGSHGPDELFSYRKGGRAKIALRARTVRDELKRECVAQGLPPNFFSSHSFLKEGVTHIGPDTPRGRRFSTLPTTSPPGGDHWPRTHWPAAGDPPSSTSRS